MIFLTKFSNGDTNDIGLHVQHIIYIEDCCEGLHTWIYTTHGDRIWVVEPYEYVLELIEAVRQGKN